MMETGAYGAGKAGAPFDPISFVQRPTTILRLLSWLFSIIVFGCISSQGWDFIDQEEVCLYNKDSNACNYGVGIGVIAFLASTAFLVGDALFDQFSSVKTRKHYVLADLGFSGFWSFLYFVGFCYLTNQWRQSSVTSTYGVNNVQGAIAFSFFSIFTWAGSAYFAFLKYKQGSEQAFAPSYEADPATMVGGVGGGAPFSFPGGPDPVGGYQEPPFNNSGMDTSGGQNFQPTSY